MLIFLYQALILLYQKMSDSEIDYLIWENDFPITKIIFWFQKFRLSDKENIFWYQ